MSPIEKRARETAASIKRRRDINLSSDILPVSFQDESDCGLASEALKRNWAPVERRVVEKPQTPETHAQRMDAADPTHYFANRAAWPTLVSRRPRPQPKDAKDIVKTGSVMLSFDPNFVRSPKPVAPGSKYPEKCARVSLAHSERAGGHFTLTRRQEPFEKANIPESTDFGRLYSAVSPIFLRAPGLPRAMARKEGMMATTDSMRLLNLRRPKDAADPSAVIAAKAAAALAPADIEKRRRRQQPAVPTPYYQTAVSTIDYAGPNRPYKPGAGLAREGNVVSSLNASQERETVLVMEVGSKFLRRSRSGSK